MQDDDVGTGLAWGVIVLGVVVILVLLLAGIGLLWDRRASKYAEETRHQVYDTSREYQQGTQLDLSRYCTQYHAATGPARNAMAGLIRDTAATYTGPLTANNHSCLQEVGQ